MNERFAHMTYRDLADARPTEIIEYINMLDECETGIDTHFGDDAAGSIIIKRLAERLNEARRGK